MSDESQVRMIPVARIRVVNPRARDKQKFDEIVESISKVGLKVPITVTRGKPGDNGTEMFDLVCGQGRLEAFIALGQKEIPALIREFTKSEILLASLIENIARRRVGSLDQVRLIEWMRKQGQGNAEIARKTGLAEVYVRDILAMLRKGEERLLEGVLHGRVPISIAMSIAGASDAESQRILMAAYEREGMTKQNLVALKRIVDQRRMLGRAYGPRQGSRSRRTTAESLVAAYKHEAQRQRLMVKKAKLCEAKLLAMSAAFKVLVRDEDYVNLLRAEKIETMPKFLAKRAREVA